MRTTKRVLVAVGLAVALCGGLALRGASAQESSAFACYSVWEVNPGVWPANEKAVFSSWSSYASGYWAPFAEKSIATANKAGPYYLTCAFPTGWTVSGTYVLGDGTDVTNDAVYFVDSKPIPGVYLVIAPS
jgi:hypothetical protein